MAALPAQRIKRVADLYTVDGRNDIVITRAAHDRPALQLAHHPGQHVTVLLPGKRCFDVRAGLVRLRDRREPELPQLANGYRGQQVIMMIDSEWLETHAASLQHNGSRFDHVSSRRIGACRAIGTVIRLTEIFLDEGWTQMHIYLHE